MTNPVADVKPGQIQPQLEGHADAPERSSGESVHTPTADERNDNRGAHAAGNAHQHKPGVLPSLQSLLNLIVIAIFIITFCAQPFRIPSESMESTLLVGDFLLVNKQAASANDSSWLLPTAAIHRGDIVVFHDPVDTTLHLVKRVIGLPGDHLRLHAGHVLINGHLLTEPYAVYRPSPPDNFRDNFPRLQSADPEIDAHWWIRMRSLIDNGELIIPTGNYFVMGDNRNDSEDSRYWGFVPRENIVGEPMLIYFSLQQHDVDDSGTLTQEAHAENQRHHSSKIDTLVDFARWGRIFQVVK
jgi:signal peptidase I